MSEENPHYFPPNYVTFFVKMDDLPYGTTARDVTFMMGHEAFLIFNAFNVFYVLVFEYYVFQRLQTNYLLKLVVSGCLLQALSCTTTMVRYNMGNEYNFLGLAGVFLGNAAFACVSAAITLIFCDKGSNAFKIILSAFCIFFATSSIVTWVFWEQLRFDVFRFSVPISQTYIIAGLIRSLVRLYKPNAETTQGFILSMKNHESELLKRLVIALLGMTIFAMVLIMSKRPLLSYGATGVGFFTVAVIFFSHVGYVKEEDLYRDEPENEEAVTNENTPLQKNVV